MGRKIIYIIIDLILLWLSFLFLAWFKPGTLSTVLPQYTMPFIYFSIIWLIMSIALGKYQLNKIKHSRDVLFPILISNFTILSIVAISIYSFQVYYYSRAMVLGTIGIASILEVLLGLALLAFKVPVRIREDQDVRLNGHVSILADELNHIEVHEDERKKSSLKLDDESFNSIKNLIVSECNIEVFKFINKVTDLYDPKNLITATTTRFNILNQPDQRFNNVINLKRINDIRYINKFFESVNSKIPYGGIYIDCAETYSLRKQRILRRNPPVINKLIYLGDWIWNRAFPKIPIVKKFYFFITRGHSRVISKAETFGRLYSCGFEIVHEEFVNDCQYFCARKIGEPAYDYNPTYGPIITLKRYGKKGKLFNVYKLRTMHPYAEYLQQYVYDNFKLDEGGKFNNDFRVNTVGKYMRKVWLDELPMLVNVLKGDMKIVGVRPLSKHYFELYTEELRQMRIKTKPGLIPPFYVDMPKTLEEIMESEKKYLIAYKKNPLFTDIRYFFGAFYNIAFKRARSA